METLKTVVPQTLIVKPTMECALLVQLLKVKKLPYPEKNGIKIKLVSLHSKFSGE